MSGGRRLPECSRTVVQRWKSTSIELGAQHRTAFRSVWPQRFASFKNLQPEWRRGTRSMSLSTLKRQVRSPLWNLTTILCRQPSSVPNVIGPVPSRTFSIQVRSSFSASLSIFILKVEHARAAVISHSFKNISFLAPISCSLLPR